MEAALDGLQRSARSRSSADDIGRVIAVLVGGPDRILIGAHDLPGHLISTGRRLHADRHDRGTKQTRHIVRALEFQRGRDCTRVVIKIIVIANLDQTYRAIRLDRCPADDRIIDLRSGTCIARDVGCRRSKSMGSVRKWVGRIAPCTTAVRGCRAEQRCPVEYIHFAIGFCGASQHHLIRIDNGVAHDDRGGRRSPVDGDTQRGRRRTGIAGHIGGRRGQTVRAVRQRRRRIGPGAAAVGRLRCPAGSCRQTP